MKQKLMDLLKSDTKIIRGIFYLGFTFIFGYAALYKILEYTPMMEGMLQFGFNRNWTLIIGYAELLGTIGLVLGLKYPKLLLWSVVFLIPFSIGAFTAHMARSEYHHFHNALFCCIACVVLIITDKKLSIRFSNE